MWSISTLRLGPVQHHGSPCAAARALAAPTGKFVDVGGNCSDAFVSLIVSIFNCRLSASSVLCRRCCGSNSKSDGNGPCTFLARWHCGRPGATWLLLMALCGACPTSYHNCRATGQAPCTAVSPLSARGVASHSRLERNSEFALSVQTENNGCRKTLKRSGLWSQRATLLYLMQ